MGTSILATICAERLTKFLVRYSRAQSTSTHHICYNSDSLRRVFPVLDKFVPQKKAAPPLAPMAERKYASMWLHRPTLVKPKIYGEVTKKNLPVSENMAKKTNAPLCLQLPRDQLASVSRKFLAVQPKLTQPTTTTGLIPKIAGLVQMNQSKINTTGRMEQQTRMKSTTSRYSEYYPKPAHCQTYGDYLKKFDRLKFCRNWQ